MYFCIVYHRKKPIHKIPVRLVLYIKLFLERYQPVHSPPKDRHFSIVGFYLSPDSLNCLHSVKILFSLICHMCDIFATYWTHPRGSCISHVLIDEVKRLFFQHYRNGMFLVVIGYFSPLSQFSKVVYGSFKILLVIPAISVLF